MEESDAGLITTPSYISGKLSLRITHGMGGELTALRSTGPAMFGSPAGRGQVIAAGCSAALILVASLVAIPYGRVPLTALASFMPAFGAVTFVTDLVTATLLLTQARATREHQTFRLGAAYLFSATAIVPHLLAFPGAFAVNPVIGASVSAVWLWCFWHGGFACGVLWYAVGRSRPMRQRELIWGMAGVLAVVVAAATLATAGLSWLPTILEGTQFSRLNSLGIGPSIVAITLVAAILVSRRMRQTALSLWLSVAMLAACFDVTLTLLGGGRFTAGWYIARVLSLTTGVTVLVALLTELCYQASQVVHVNEQLEHLLRIDVLTGVANRRAFEQALEMEGRRARREQTSLSFVMIDIDFFKRYNDQYGHGAGDICLHDVATALQAAMKRPGDMAARWGGEEFVLLLPNTEEEGAAKVAERVRAAVAKLAIPHLLNPPGYVTISLGVATCRPDDTDVEHAVLEAADRALYRAKAEGRNRVQVALALRPEGRLMSVEAAGSE